MTEYFVYGDKLPDDEGDIRLAGNYAFREVGRAANDSQRVYRLTPVDAATDGEQALEGVWIVTGGAHIHIFRTELEALRYAYPLEGFIEVSFKSFEESGT
jgi:hypothetical protein